MQRIILMVMKKKIEYPYQGLYYRNYLVLNYPEIVVIGATKGIFGLY